MICHLPKASIKPFYRILHRTSPINDENWIRRQKSVDKTMVHQNNKSKFIFSNHYLKDKMVSRHFFQHYE